MPLYEYNCSNCKKTLEVIQKFSDAPLTTCPECGGSVSKLMSRTSFQLKGSGWYATDYKKSTASSMSPVTTPADTSEKKPTGPGDKGGCGSGGCASE